MKKNIFFILGALFLITVMGCINSNEETTKKIQPIQLKQFEWLLGKWGQINDKKQLYEIWEKRDDTFFVGKSLMIVNGDTVFQEKMILTFQGSETYFIPAVENQNDGKPITFKLISDSLGAFVFENKKHDFPQQIIYSNPIPDSLYAKIQGNEKGKFNFIEFPMTKIK